MANIAREFTIRGTIDWCKLFGAARPYTGDPKFDKGPSWSIEINPDEKSRKQIEMYGLNDKLKTDKPKKKDGTPTKNPRSYDFLRLNILETRQDGSKNKPPVVKDSYGNAWNREIELGNGTVADILVRFVDYGTTQGLYFKEMMVLKLVPFEGSGETLKPLSEDDEFFATLEDRSDDVPFAGEPYLLPDAIEPTIEEDLNDDVPY